VEYCKGNVKCNSGRWYFELKVLQSYGIQVGWCTENFNPVNNTGGSSWTFDIYGAKLNQDGKFVSSYGQNCYNNDVIGCCLDIDKQKMIFYKNGTSFGDAFSGAISPGTGRLIVLIALSRNSRCKINFGKDPFTYPQENYYPLHCLLTDAELGQVEKLFQKYKEIGIKLSESGETADAIKMQGTLQIYKDLGIDGDDDVGPFLLAWKLKAEILWQISRDEFINGLTVIGAASIDGLKNKVSQWKKEMFIGDNFKNLYFFYI